MRIYKKPEISITVFKNDDVITGSSVGLTARFNRITEDNQTNAIQLDSLHS